MHKAKVMLSRMTEPILWTLAVLPLMMMVSASLTESLMPAWISLFITLCGGCLIVCLRKWRLLVALACSVILFASALPLSGRIFVFVNPLIGSLILLYSASAKSQDKAYANPVFRMIAAGILYLAAQYCTSRTTLPDYEKYQMIKGPILVGFLLFFLIEILIVNTRTIQEEAVGDSIPTSVVRHNTVLAVCAFLFATFIGSIRAIGEMLSSVWQMIKEAISSVIAFLLSLLPDSQPAGGMGGGGDLSGMMAGEEVQASFLAKLLEKIAAVLAAILLIVLLVLLFRAAAKKMQKLFSKLKIWLSNYMKSTSMDYTDEISDTRESRERSVATLFRRKKKRPYSDEMTDSEKVRYTYGVMMDHHPDWNESETVRDRLDVQNASIYEKVRYAEREATAEEAESFRHILHSPKENERK